MTATAPETIDLQRAAREHLWLHFSRMAGYRDGEVPIIVRGDGCYLEDIKGKRGDITNDACGETAECLRQGSDVRK